jgi:putative acetyltransferase
MMAQTGYGEIKRVYVDDAPRGLGAGRQIVAYIERAAAAAVMDCLPLETGIRQSEALDLHRSCGYAEIGAFGDYKPDPVSVFMEKRL